MNQQTIRLEGAVARNPLVRLGGPVTLALGADEHVAIVGPNGAGKSLLVGLLTGQYPLREGTLNYDFTPSLTRTAYDNIRYIAFRDTYGSADANYYYQKRWNAHDQDDAPLVRDLLGRAKDEEQQGRLLRLFGLQGLLDKKIILLSSGELRKFQLAKALQNKPRILVMDNPFIGLDAGTRQLLLDLLRELSSMGDLQIVLVVSMMDEVPDFVTHVVSVDGGRVGEKVSREEYLEAFAVADAERQKADAAVLQGLRQRVMGLPYSKGAGREGVWVESEGREGTRYESTGRESMGHEGAGYDSEEVVRLNRVSIRYDDRTILRELDWTVKRGEKWALSGDNGSGKSTLLSLVCADNPQSYACDISLFGRRRGTGESIWEIKKHIGYVSPEMHRAYLKNLPTIEIVASGLHDSIGLYVRPHAEQLATCQWWMETLGIGGLADRPFLQLSSGEQRLALVARAFVKDPELLILDEPLHGLDTYHRRRVRAIIEAWCGRRDKTLIMVTHYASELPSTIDHHLYLRRNDEAKFS